MKLEKTSKWVRFAILMGLLAWITYEAYMHQVLGGAKAASVHALCPYGALESLYALIFSASFIKKIYSGTLILLILTIAIAILFRRSFCGLLCPFGALQELFGTIGKKIFGKSFIMPKKVDKPLRYLKYFILPLTLIMAWYYQTLWMSAFDPYAAYAHITDISGAVKEEPLAATGFVILFITAAGSFFYERFFCKYMCPMGAFYGIIGKVSLTKIERNNNSCAHCKACNNVCPVNIEIENQEKVNSMECISCNLCVTACPKKGALEIKTGKKVMNPMLILVIVTGLFFGTILSTEAIGKFEVLNSQVKSGEKIEIQEIKGYYTIEETAAATSLILDEVYEKLEIPKSVSKTTKMKDISKEVPEFNFDIAKEKLKE